jgi:hypothetical protein
MKNHDNHEKSKTAANSVAGPDQFGGVGAGVVCDADPAPTATAVNVMFNMGSFQKMARSE